MTPRRRQADGQTGQAVLLAVMAVLVLSISVVSGLRFIGPKLYLQQQQQQKVVTGLSVVNPTTNLQKAILLFVARNYRLPCPADGTIAQGALNDGVENCKVTGNIGVIPWKTLGLTYDSGLDGWQHRFGYAVSADLTTGQPFQLQAPGSAFDKITVSANGAQANYAYAIINFGQDGAGAMLPSGNRLTPPASTVLEYPNTLASAFGGTGAVANPGSGACSAQTTTFVVCPSDTIKGTSGYFDDTLTYQTSKQIYDVVNDVPGDDGNGGGGNNQLGPQLAQLNTSTAAINASPGSINNPYSCGTGAGFCPGSTNAGSLANTLSFVGGGGPSLAGQSLSLVAGLGTVGVQGANANGTQVGNQGNPLYGVGAQNGDWIGANQFGNCPQCAGAAWTPNYMIPGQTLTYAFAYSYYSFAFVDYLVDGGMQVQVDGYLGSAYNLTGNLTDGSTTITGLSSTLGLQDGQSVVGPGVAGGVQIAGVVGSTLTMTQAATEASANEPLFAASAGTPVTVFTAIETPNSNFVTGVSSTTGLAANQTLVGFGVLPNTTISDVIDIQPGDSQLIVSTPLSPALTPNPLCTGCTAGLAGEPMAATSSAQPITFMTGTVTKNSSVVTNVTVNSQAGPTIAMIGMNVYGQGILPGTTITAVNPPASITLSQKPNVTQVGSQVNVISNSFNITGNTQVGSNTITNVSSTAGLYYGMQVFGSGIPGDTIVVDASGSTITMSQNATLAANNVPLFVTPWFKIGTQIVSNSNTNNYLSATGVATLGQVTAHSNAVTNLASTVAIGPGQPVTGAFIPPGTLSVGLSTGPSGNALLLNQPATTTDALQPIFITTESLLTTPVTGTVSNSTTVTNLSSSTGISVGQSIVGSGIPGGTTVSAVPSNNSLILSKSGSVPHTENGVSLFPGYSPPITGVTGFLTAESLLISNVTPTTNLAVGQTVTAPGLPHGTTIRSISGSAVDLSQFATKTGTASLTLYNTPPQTQVFMTGNTGVTPGAITGVPANALPGVGMSVALSGLPTGQVGVVSSVAGSTVNSTVAPTASLTGISVYGTYAPCPGPASNAPGTGIFPGIYAPVEPHESASPPDATHDPLPDPAPTPQHPPVPQGGAVPGQIQIPSQIWPQPGTANAQGASNTALASATSNPNLLSGNYVDQRDYQFANRMFTDAYGNPQRFNILVFQVLPYTYTNGKSCVVNGVSNSTCLYGMLFEGLKACTNDTYSGDCVLAGSNEWWNPPVAETMDCDQHPS